MAEIQLTSLAKFVQVVSAQKLGNKGPLPVGQELASFLGALKAQLNKSDVVDDPLALELKADGVKKPVRTQSDSEFVLPKTVASVSVIVPLINESTLQAAAVSAAVSSVASSPQGGAGGVQLTESESGSNAESDLIRGRADDKIGRKSVVAAKPDELLKPRAAANAADVGQALPSLKSSRPVDSSSISVDAKPETRIESVISSSLPKLEGLRDGVTKLLRTQSDSESALQGKTGVVQQAKSESISSSNSNSASDLILARVGDEVGTKSVVAEKLDESLKTRVGANTADVGQGLLSLKSTQQAKSETISSTNSNSAPSLILARVVDEVGTKSVVAEKLGESLKTRVGANTADVGQGLLSLKSTQQDKSESISSTNSNSASDLILARVGDEVGTKPVVTAKTDELFKSPAAENSADAGQGLPSLMSARQADSSRFSVDVKPEARIESVLSSTLSSLEGRRVDSDAPESTIVTQPFVRVLSQVESKINVSIEAPVRSAAFTSELADKVVWLSGRQGQLADLLLNPPEMGTLEVRLTVSGGDASAQFYSPNPVVRDAIDAALPKLRELMAQSRISLGETEVRDQAFSQLEHLEMPAAAASTAVNSSESALQRTTGSLQQVKSESIGSSNSNSASDLILARVGDEVGTKSVVADKSEESLKTRVGANAADVGQGLLSLKSTRQVESSRVSVDAKPEAGIESVLSSASPSLEGGREGVKKLLRPQSDSEPALPEAAASVPLMASLLNAPMLQDAAVSAAVNSSESALKGKAGVVQQAKSESISSTNSNSAPSLILARVIDEVGTKPVVTAKTDELFKSPAAENAADAGQGLLSFTSARQADSSRFSVDMKPEARIESVLSSTLSSLEGRRVDSDAPESIIVTQPFERVLSQVESKINVSIEAPVRSAAFTSELADKVVWLSGRQGQLADLLLNPPEMGTLEVRLTVSGGDASAQFYSPNPVVRDAIDAALPKLRELMAQSGISLGETEVRDQAFSQRENLEMQGRRTVRSAEINPQPAALAAIGVVKSAGLGLVDLYI